MPSCSIVGLYILSVSAAEYDDSSSRLACTHMALRLLLVVLVRYPKSPTGSAAAFGDISDREIATPASTTT